MIKLFFSLSFVILYSWKKLSKTSFEWLSW